MISILIASFKEPKTITKSIKYFLKQNIKERYEIIVSAPDLETQEAVKKLKKNNKKIKLIKDKGKGKPAALNLMFKKAKGEILILSDGDVFVGKNSVNNLLKHFKDKKVGAVSGKPIPKNSRKNMLGFWAYLLTEGIHKQRIHQKDNNQNITCSGYLYGIRNIIKKIPEDILADDAYITFKIIEKGYKTEYEEKAKVYVTYPKSLQDWIRQKKRTSSRYYQLKKYFDIKKLRNFSSELLLGVKSLFLINNFKELFWFFFLIIMRFYLWFRIFLDFRLWNRQFEKTWERVETTKSIF